jgi:hypothetical protein
MFLHGGGRIAPVMGVKKQEQTRGRGPRVCGKEMDQPHLADPAVDLDRYAGRRRPGLLIFHRLALSRRLGRMRRVRRTRALLHMALLVLRPGALTVLLVLAASWRAGGSLMRLRRLRPGLLAPLLAGTLRIAHYRYSCVR